MVKNLPANAEDKGSIPGLGRCPGEESGRQKGMSTQEDALEKKG